MKNNYNFGLWRWQFMALLLCLVCLFPSKSSAQVTLGTQEVEVGGATSTPTPYNYFWESRRVQFIYTAAEIAAAGGAAGDITSLAWDVSVLNEDVLENYQIRMAAVTETNVAAHNTATLTTVRNAADLVPGNTGFYVIPFDTPFTWDGTSNILIDVCWGVNGDFSGTGTVWMYNNVANQRRGINSSSTDRCGENTTTIANSKPRIQFEMPLLPACEGTPTAGTAIASATSICAGGTSLISIINGESSINLTYLWEQSTDGGTTWEPATGTNSNANYTTAALTQTTRFRRVTTCTNGGASATSTDVEVDILNPTTATLPYTQTFDAWESQCANSDVPDQNWKQTPSTTDIDASWRRQDQGSTVPWSFAATSTAGLVTPFEGAGAANFRTFWASSGTSATLDLYINLEGTNPANPKKLTFRYQNTSGNDRLEVSLSTDGGATFSAPLATYNAPASWVLQTLDITGGTANSVIRFRAVSDFGNDDIGIDNLDIIETFPCAGIPTAGTTVASSESFCGSGEIGLSVTGSSADSFEGLTFLWEVSTDGGTTWNPAPGTNDEATYTATVTENSSFRRQITCTASAETTTSTPVAIAEYSPAYFALSPANPLDERFGTWENGCSNSDVPSNNWFNTPATGNRSWRRQDQQATAGWTSPTSGAVALIDANEGFIARFHTWSVPNGQDGLLDFYVDLSGTGPKTLSFFYRNSSGADRLELLLSEDGGATFSAPLLNLTTNTAWTTHTLAITSTSPTAVIRFRGISDFGFTDIGLDNLSLVELAPCAGVPVGGTVSASATDVCVATPILSVTGASDADSFGFSFQWQASTDGGATWTDIPGATLATFAANPSENTSYRRQITCDASGESAFSTEVEITVTYAPTYYPFSAANPFLEEFETWGDGCNNSDVPGINWKNTPSTGNNSWRRQDQGATANWSFLPTGIVTPTSGAGAANFHSYGAGSGLQGALDLYVDMSAATGSVALKFLYQNATGTDNLRILLSTDGGATFTQLGQLFTAAWAEQLFVFSSTSPTTIIRFLATSDFGLNDIGLDDVSLEEVLPCTGTPVAGVAVISPTNACVSSTATVSIVDDENTDLRTFQWQSSPDNTTWTDIPDATGEELVVSNVAATTWYRRVTTCAASGESAASTSVSFQVPFTTVYATLPYLENFEPAWIDGCANNDVPNNSWKNTPATGNNSWRRQNDGASAGWVFLADPEPFFLQVVPISGTGAAAFHSYGAPAGQVGTLDVFVDANVPGDKQLKFLYNNRDGSPFGNTDQLQVQISTDGGATFTTLLTLGASTAWSTQTVPFTSDSPTTVIRFRATSDFGGSDIGIDDVQVVALTPCAGTPIGGIATASAPNTCTTPPITVSVSGSSEDTSLNLSFLWEVSTDGGTTWNPAPGANTGSSYQASPNVTSLYRRITTCDNSGDTAPSTSATITVIAPTYAALPFAETFDSWSNRCATSDVPGANWINTPVTGNNSWRRQDQGATANWEFLTNAFFTPIAPFEGAGAAVFHSFGAEQNSQGTLDVYFNASPVGTKRLTFYYINPNHPTFGDFMNPDFVDVLLSVDGGATFGAPILTATTTQDNGWTRFTVDFDTESASAVIRIRATDPGQPFISATNLGIDALSIVVVTPCAGTPVAGTTTVAPVNSCDTPEVNASVIGSSEDSQTGFTFLWEQSTDGGVTWLPADGTNTNSTYTATPAVTTQYRRVITCTASAESATSTPATFTVVAPVPAALPYTQTFESSWIDGCGNNDLPDIHWRGTPPTGNNSWRRQDEGATAGWVFLGDLTAFPQINAQPISGNGAAAFHSWGAPNGDQGELDLHIDASVPGAKAVRFLYLNRDQNVAGVTGNSDILEVFESDNGVDFTLLGTLGTSNTWAEFSFPLTVTSGNAIVRFRATSDFGASNIGIDNVNVFLPVPCAGTPNGGVTRASTTDFCIDPTPELSVIGSSNPEQTDLTFQWQQSTDGGVTWEDIEGETGLTTVVAPTVTTSYRRQTLCTNSGESAFSVPVEIEASPIVYASLPIEESFDTWDDLCASNDIPLSGEQVYWRNTPATGNESWRRQDQGTTANWTFPATNVVAPFEGSGAANFHSWWAPTGSEGLLDLYVDFSSPNQKILSFRYTDPEGPDNIDVLISTDGGATFNIVAENLAPTEEGEWVEQTFTLTEVSPTTIIRLRGQQLNFFAEALDMGIDNLKVIAPFAFDVGVTAINLDLCSPAFSNVAVEITNFGTEPASDFPVSYTLAGGATITEQFTGTIEPFGTATFVFNVPVSLQAGTLDITAATAYAIDEDLSNDALNRVFENAVGGLALPYFTNFDEGLPSNWTNEVGASGWFSATPNNPPAFEGTFPDDPFAYTFDIDQGPAFDGDNAFMAVDDDAAGSGGPTGSDFLIMPRLDLSNYTDVNLTFDIFFEEIGSSEFTVDVSTDGGVTYDAPIYTRDATTNWITEIVSLDAYEGQSSVTIRFTYFDGNIWAYGVAIDNVGVDGTLGTLPDITVSTPIVEDAFVLQGTQNHILYKMDLAVLSANASLSDVVFTTGGTYDDDDLVANSFRLWYSTDDVLGVGDTQLGAFETVASGSQLIFNCLSQPINIGTIGYLFLTVDIDPAGTIDNTVFVTTPSISTDVIFLSGNVTGTTVAGGVQTIAGPNTPPTSEDNRVQTIKNTAYTFAATDFAFADVDPGDELEGVKISATNLPPGATLTLGGLPVEQGTIIDVANIANLVFTPAPDEVRTNYASITFKVFDGRDLSELRYTLIIDVVSDEIFVPRLFSPNGDAANETFRILGGEGNIANLVLKIFDRNNNLVFETNSITEATQTGWDGTKDGTEQPAGAYIWLIEGTYNDGTPLEFEGKKTGVIRLLR